MWSERAIGIALGLVVGIGAVTAFVFLGSRSTIDAPEIADGGERTATTTTTATVPAEPGRIAVVRIVSGAPPSADLPQLEFNRGERVRFRVRSDSAVLVEVDRYGISHRVPADGTATFSFPATKTGEFAVLVSSSHIAVARLIVTGG